MNWDWWCVLLYVGGGDHVLEFQYHDLTGVSSSTLKWLAEPAGNAITELH